MEQLLSLIQKRQSCRSFSPNPVEEEKLRRCIEAARLAPSACNSQPWRFVVVNDSQRAEQVAACMQDGGQNRFTTGCPAFIVVIEGSQNLTARFGGTIKNQQFSGMDIGIATSHIVLEAADQGLGSCIMGWFNERKLKMLLSIPKTRRIRLVIALGYANPDEIFRNKDRKTIEEIASYNKY